MFVSHRSYSYEIGDIEIVPGFRVKVFEGDFYPAPDHEFVFILDGKEVGRVLVEDYRERLEEIKADPQPLIERLRERERQKSPVERAWEKGGFGKPI